METGRLYLVFELIATDLKKYMDNQVGMIDQDLVRVSNLY
jgi:hypothetical protein